MKKASETMHRVADDGLQDLILKHMGKLEKQAKASDGAYDRGIVQLNVLDYIIYHLIAMHGVDGGILLLHSSITDLVRQYKKDFPDHHGYDCECDDCSKCPECRVSGETSLES